MEEGSELNLESTSDVVGQLKQVLVEFGENTPILGAAIFSVEGLPVVSHFHAGTEDVTVAAMVAGIHSAGEATVRQLKQGELKSIIVEGDLGTTVLLSIHGGYILTITAPVNVKLGLVFNDGKRVAKIIARHLR